MTSPSIRTFAKLEFREPTTFLVKLREFERQVAQTDTPAKIRTLRTNSLKDMRELRQGALFCYLMGQRIGHTVYLAPGESQDYDFVAAWDAGETRNYAAVQLKEVVPEHLNPAATIDQVVNSLVKYPDSTDLVVAIHLNQHGRFVPESVRLPKLAIGSLWVFGGTSPDQSRWGLWGDFLKRPTFSEHEYPAT